jgi:hypothetical protein
MNDNEEDKESSEELQSSDDDDECCVECMENGRIMIQIRKLLRCSVEGTCKMHGNKCNISGRN